MSTLAQATKSKVTFKNLSSSDSSDDLKPERSPSDTDSLPSYRQARLYKVYRWRWLLLASLCLLNVSNGMVYRLASHILQYTIKTFVCKKSFSRVVRFTDVVVFCTHP